MNSEWTLSEVQENTKGVSVAVEYSSQLTGKMFVIGVNGFMAINSKQKGSRFERELSKKLSSYGYECRRTAQYCGNTGDASDVVGLPNIHIEAKHAEAMRLYDWVAQAVRDSNSNGRIPAVFHRKNNAEILVTLRLDDFMKIYKESIYGKEDVCGMRDDIRSEKGTEVL